MSSKSEVKSQGTLLWRVSKKFNFAAEKIIPESFVFKCRPLMRLARCMARMGVTMVQKAQLSMEVT